MSPSDVLYKVDILSSQKNLILLGSLGSFSRPLLVYTNDFTFQVIFLTLYVLEFYVFDFLCLDPLGLSSPRPRHVFLSSRLILG